MESFLLSSHPALSTNGCKSGKQQPGPEMQDLVLRGLSEQSANSCLHTSKDGDVTPSFRFLISGYWLEKKNISAVLFPMTTMLHIVGFGWEMQLYFKCRKKQPATGALKHRSPKSKSQTPPLTHE